MTINGIIQIGLYFFVLLVLVKPFGSYMAKVYQGEPFWANRILGPVERLFYRMFGIRPEDEMSWKTYAGAALVFKLACFFPAVPYTAPAGDTAAEPPGLSRGRA